MLHKESINYTCDYIDEYQSNICSENIFSISKKLYDIHIILVNILSINNAINIMYIISNMILR